MSAKKDKIKIGVVGIGHLGNYHLQKYRLIEKCEIAGVADTFLERAQKAAREYGCPAFSDYRELIGKIDAASIAVPTGEHFKVAADFLAAGIDVLIEKPICATVAEADRLITLAEKNKLILQVGFVERFNPAVMALEKVVTRPLFIEVHRLHPFFERGTDVDVVLDLMIHDLDIILKFVNAEIRSLEAVGVAVLSEKIDIANARISFAGGCIANITASRISAKTMQKIRVFSPEGYHSVDYRTREIISLSKKLGENGRQQIAQNNLEVVNHDPLEEEIRSFVTAVTNRAQPLVSGQDGRRALDLAVQIVRKINTSEVLQ
jgi:predicted dehydrogenase